MGRDRTQTSKLAITSALPINGVVCADSCLVQNDSEEAARHGNFIAIPHVEVEANLIEKIAQFSAVSDSQSLMDAYSGNTLDYLHLACHGDHRLGSGSFIKLGQVWPLNQIMSSRISPKIVFLSSCFAGKTSNDHLGNALGIASTFLLRGAKVVIGSGISVPDHLMPIFVGLMLYHAKYTFGGTADSYYFATQRAKEEFASANWPKSKINKPSFLNFFNDYYAESLLSVLPKNAKSSQTRQWMESILDKCQYIDEPSYATLNSAIHESDQDNYHEHIGFWLKSALTNIQNDRAHPTRKALFEMSTFIQIYGHPDL